MENDPPNTKLTFACFFPRIKIIQMDFNAEELLIKDMLSVV